MGKYRTIGADLNRDYRNDLNTNFEQIDTDIKVTAAETKRVETELKEQLDTFVGGGLIEGTEAARDKANKAAVNADTKAALANTKATYANTQGDYAKAQGDHAKLQGDYAKDKAVEADAAANKAIAEATNLDGLKIAVTDATQAANVSASKADTSATNAESAGLKAKTAADNADSYALKADAAADNANANALLAKQGADKANAESTGLETLKLNVTTATKSAKESAQTATTAAGNADAVTLKADTAADNADAKALEAEAQAAHALTQGDYAKEQGTHAKTQGDHAKVEGDKAALESADLAGLKEAVTSATDDAVTAAELANIESTGLASMKDEVTTATLVAEGASTQATEQADYAKAQGDFAKAEGGKAALETGNLTDAKAAVEAATSQAVTASESADVAKQATELATTNAEVVTLKADTAATNADDKALIAQTAADNADSKALEAETQATYSKTQGDYAKEQGDAVQGVFDAGLVASVNGKTGKVVLSAEDVGADTPESVNIKVAAVKDYANEQISLIPKPDFTGYETEIGAQAKADTASQSAKDYTDTKIAEIPDVDISGKVDVEAGKGLSTNDYTTAEKNKLTGIQAGAEKNIPVPVANKVQAEAGTDNSNFMTPLRTSEAIMKLSPPTDISGKVDKVAGKKLSTEDYTTVEKTKLSGVEAGAQKNVAPTWAGITGKPTTFPPATHPHAISDIAGLRTEIDTLKSSVSNGKKLIATAITGKNVPTSSSDTFEVMAGNIGLLGGFKREPTDFSGSPGSDTLIAGDMQAGYFGTVPASEIFTGSAIASAVGLSYGTLQNNETDWLKFAYEGKILFRPMKSIRSNLNWSVINSAGCVDGTKQVGKGALVYKVRLMGGLKKDWVSLSNSAIGSEWNKLILPLHEKSIKNNWDVVDVESNIPNWANFSDIDLLTKEEFGNGATVICKEKLYSECISRGRSGAEQKIKIGISEVNPSLGWAPVLELIQ